MRVDGGAAVWRAAPVAWIVVNPFGCRPLIVTVDSACETSGACVLKGLSPNDVADASVVKLDAGAAIAPDADVEADPGADTRARGQTQTSIFISRGFRA